MTDTVAQSFAHLVKSNNGLFKSPAQSQFLLSKCHNGEYVTSGSSYGHGYTLFYICDQKGVQRVQKQTVGKGLTTQWERREAGQTSIQDEKEIKRLTRKLKQIERAIADRKASYERGEYDSDELYQWGQGRDLNSVEQIKQMLAKLNQLT